ncbi:MAG: hypothetical protein J6K52_01385 [Clostridia bacterium]|nr:hypothetical protein [Clostridia bacterium]
MRSIIFGTDWGEDCDDVVALRVLCRSVKEEKINLIGVVINDAIDYSASSLEGFLNKEGVYNVPIGIDKSGANFGSHPTYQIKLSEFSKNYKSNDDAENGIRLYRRLLANAKGKVEILEVGFLQVLAGLLESEGDDISSLTGVELVKEKVEKVWCMAGKWHEDGGREYNFSRTSVACKASYVICEKCPVPITFLGWEIGNSVISGSKLDKNDYLYQALYDHGSENGRSSWDPMTALLAVIGDEEKAGYDYVVGTACVEAENGKNHFTPSSDGMHKYVIKKFDDIYYQNQLDDIIKSDI